MSALYRVLPWTFLEHTICLPYVSIVPCLTRGHFWNTQFVCHMSALYDVLPVDISGTHNLCPICQHCTVSYPWTFLEHTICLPYVSIVPCLTVDISGTHNLSAICQHCTVSYPWTFLEHTICLPYVSIVRCLTRGHFWNTQFVCHMSALYRVSPVDISGTHNLSAICQQCTVSYPWTFLEHTICLPYVSIVPCLTRGHFWNTQFVCHMSALYRVLPVDISGTHNLSAICQHCTVSYPWTFLEHTICLPYVSIVRCLTRGHFWNTQFVCHMSALYRVLPVDISGTHNLSVICQHCIVSYPWTFLEHTICLPYVSIVRCLTRGHFWNTQFVCHMSALYRVLPVDISGTHNLSAICQPCIVSYPWTFLEHTICLSYVSIVPCLTRGHFWNTQFVCHMSALYDVLPVDISGTHNLSAICQHCTVSYPWTFLEHTICLPYVSIVSCLTRGHFWNTQFVCHMSALYDVLPVDISGTHNLSAICQPCIVSYPWTFLEHTICLSYVSIVPCLTRGHFWNTQFVCRMSALYRVLPVDISGTHNLSVICQHCTVSYPWTFLEHTICLPYVSIVRCLTRGHFWNTQ